MEEQRFHTGEVDITYAESPASGPPLVLLHGLATRWQIFRPLIRRLSKEWHVYALDFRGHGTSGRTPGRYSVGAFADDVVAFLEAKVDEPAVLFGHSMGGWVAAAVAARVPERVRAIVLADTDLYPVPIPDDATVMALFGVDTAAIRSGRTGGIQGFQSLKDLDQDVLLAYLEGRLTSGFDAETLLPQVQCPALLLQGNMTEGGFMSDEGVRRALTLLPQGSHVFFPESGHWLHVQQPAEVAEAAGSFLAAV